MGFMNLIYMFTSVVDVLEIVTMDDSNTEQRSDALDLLISRQIFESTFLLHLIKNYVGKDK